MFRLWVTWSVSYRYDGALKCLREGVIVVVFVGGIRSVLDDHLMRDMSVDRDGWLVPTV